MRKVIFTAATSLDLFLARLDGSVDWLVWSDEAASLMAQLWKTVDTTIMGRKTYEEARRHSAGAAAFPGVHTYVFSRTLKPGTADGVTILTDEAARIVAQLKRQPGEGICLMGGGELAKTLFEAELIDELALNIHPILLGAGIPLFHPMSRQTDLTLKDCRAFQNGCIVATYGIKRAN